MGHPDGYHAVPALTEPERSLGGVDDRRTRGDVVACPHTSARARESSNLPWEISGGLAYVGSRFEVEVDLHGYTSISAYPMLSTNQPTAIYSDTAAGGPTVTTIPTNSLTTASKGIVNVAAGRSFRINPEKPWLVHFGVASDLSPVTEGDEVFTKADSDPSRWG